MPSWRLSDRMRVPNAGLKLLALILAALSFYAIRGVTSFEVRYDVPVEVSVEKGTAILEQDAEAVQVTFRGSPEDLRHVEQSQLRAVVKPKTRDFGGTMPNSA